MSNFSTVIDASSPTLRKNQGKTQNQGKSSRIREKIGKNRKIKEKSGKNRKNQKKLGKRKN
jgi:hypothetical protein